MELGAFSISLTVSDLAASQAFYEKLGFTVTRISHPCSASPPVTVKPSRGG